MSPRLQVLALALLVIALLAVLVEPYTGTTTREVPPAAAVRANDFLALGRLLEQSGAPVQLYAQLPATPPAGATLFLTVSGRMLGAQERDALLAWVADGGRLLLAPRNSALWQQDPLLAAIGLKLVDRTRPADEQADDIFADDAGADDDAVDNASADAEDAEADADADKNTDADADTDDPVFADDAIAGFYYPVAPDRAVRAGFIARRVIMSNGAAARARSLFCDPWGCHGWQVPHGRGDIIVLSDVELFTNDYLADWNHAAIATLLLQPQPGRPLWLVYQEQVPSIFVLVWQHAWFAVLALAALVLLWLASVLPRFGPVQAGATAPRRRLAEHVIAAGNLLAREGRQRALWQAVHDDFRRTLQRRHPQAHGLDADATRDLVARLTGAEPAQVQAALTPPPAGTGTSTPTELAALERSIRSLDFLRRLL